MQMYGLKRDPESAPLRLNVQGTCPGRSADAKNATERARVLAWKRKQGGAKADEWKMPSEYAANAETRRIAQRRACALPTRRFNVKTGVGVKTKRTLGREIERLL